MSDETTPGLRDLRDQIPEAIMAEVEHVMIELLKRAESAERLAAAAMETVGRLQRDERTTELLRRQQEDRAEQADATVARVKALAEDMRTWCSPHGIAVTYAQRIEEAIDPPEPVGIEADSEAEFAAKLGAIMRKHRTEVHPEHAEACGNCAVIKGAPEILTAGLDDLPAVRAFAANHDPRQEDR